MFVLNLGVPTILFYLIVIILILLGIVAIIAASKKTGPDATALAILGIACIIAGGTLLAIPYHAHLQGGVLCNFN